MAASKYKIIIFDLDDTLIDNYQNVKHGFKKMLAAADVAYSDEALECWNKIDKKFWSDRQDGSIELPIEFRHETGEKSPEFLDYLRSQRVMLYFDESITRRRAIELNNIYMQALTEMVVPIEGARETLEAVSARGVTIVVASNGPSIATQAKLRKIGCLDFVSGVLSADMFGYMKPHIEFSRGIEQKYQDFERKDYLIVGDSLKTDVGFGMNAGIDSCWFNQNGRKLTSEYRPTFVIEHLSELLDII